MERPLSAASSATTRSTTSVPAQHHRRNASSTKNAVRPSPSNTAALFLANLRLLDLDLYADWPGITTSSFSNQDARTRLKCAEYALYQLFRLYDPTTTAEKLQPFFPPLEPLQSINLRAALFRCLNELKKNGVLPKDSVLRKTMLDECSGEKFWEVCLAFSNVVLRKSKQGKRRSGRSRVVYGVPVAEKMGAASSVGKRERESMLPLAIAHKVALSRVLDEKQGKRERYGRLHDRLVEKEDELLRRKAKAQEWAQNARKLRPDRLKAVEDTVEKNWIGGTDLKDALVDGDTIPKGDALLVQSFDHVWNHGDDDHDGLESRGATIGLLQRLHDRTTAQSARLRRWQHFYDRLSATKPASARSSRPASQAQRTGVTFNRHQDIHLNDSSDDSEESDEPPKPVSRNNITMRYDEILNAMREDLRKNSVAYRNNKSAVPATSQPQMPHIRRASTQPVPPVRKLSVAIDTSAGAPNLHARSPSQTTVPLRSPMGRRVSSRSRSYEKPKVESMREHIPLKSEIFSPLKDSRRSSVSPASLGGSVLASPKEEAEAEDEKGPGIGGGEEVDADAEVDSVVKSPASPRDSGLGLKTDGILPNGRIVVPESESNGLDGSGTSRATAGVSAQLSQTPAVRPSLAERTRQSMAFNSLDNIHHHTSSDSSDSASLGAGETPPLTTTTDQNTAPTNRRTTLAERTRQSMSFAPTPAPAPVSKKSSHNRSRTSIYPVNQFETPRKDRRSTVGDREETRNITPMEQLMSPEAEYANVFKSRPKIAMSPVLSPGRNADLGTPPALDDESDE